VLGLEEEASAVLAAGRNRDEVVVAHYDEAVTWISALAAEFAPLASRRGASASYNGIARQGWLIRVSPQSEQNIPLSFYVIVYSDGSWAWVHEKTSEWNPTKYAAIKPRDVRTFLVNPQAVQHRNANLGSIAYHFRTNVANMITELYIRSSFVRHLAELMR
jgi:hypothetical protein